MAAKEIAIKIKVDGKEVTLAGKDVSELKKQLDQASNAADETADSFDNLNNESENLSDTFEETTDDVNEFTNTLEETQSKAEALKEEINLLESQLKDLGPRTLDNADEFDDLTEKLERNRNELRENSLNAERLGENFSRIPGPIGATAGSIEALAISGKKIKGAFDLATVGVSSFSKALIASGIGAIVVALGLLIAGAVRAFQTFEPLQDAVKNLGTSFGFLGDAIQPLIDLIGKGLTAAVNGFAKAVAWVTGNLDEYNQKLADTKALDDYIKKSEDIIQQLKAQALVLDGVAKKQVEAQIEYLEKLVEIDKKIVEEQGTLVKEIENSLAKQEDIYAKFTDEQIAAYTQYLTDREKAQEEYNQTLLDITTVFEEKRLELENEYRILALNEQKDKEKEALEQEYKAQQESIKQLEITEEQKIQLLEQLKRNYNLKLKELNDTAAKEEAQANEDLRRQIRDIRTSMIEDDRERAAQEAKNRRDDSIKAIEELTASEELKEEAILAVRQQYSQELKQITDDYVEYRKTKGLEEVGIVLSQIEFERETRQMGLDRQLQAIENFYGSSNKAAKMSAQVLREQAQITFEQETEAVKRLEEQKIITKEQANARLIELEKGLSVEILRINNEMYDKVSANILALGGAVSALGSSVGQLAGYYSGLASSLAEGTEEQKKAEKQAKILIKVQQALAAVTQTLALVEAFRGLAKDIGKGFPTNLIAVASTLALIASTFLAWKQFTAKSSDIAGVSSGGGATGASGPNYGKNYADGGMIKGKRHAQGGTIIEAEDGEAVMTRGAVSLFRPLLSMMNQMGGGTSFDARLVNYDAPNTSQPQEMGETIIKTYVVESDISSSQEKAARLKDISTI